MDGFDLQDHSICKFTSENWKVIQEFKEEKRKLELFEASQNSLLELNESLENGLTMGTTQSPVNITLPSSRTDVEVIEILSPSPNSQLISKILQNSESNEENNLLSPSLYLGKDNDFVMAEIPTGNPIKIEKYFQDLNYNKCPSSSSSIEMNNKEVKRTSQTSNSGGNKSLARDNNEKQKYLPLAMTLIATILFQIPKVKLFVKENLWVECASIRKNIENYPTLIFLIEAIAFDAQKLLDEEKESLTEPLSLLVLSTLEIFHEELIQAKKDGTLKYICFRDCSYLMMTELLSKYIVKVNSNELLVKIIPLECIVLLYAQSLSRQPFVPRTFNKEVIDYLGKNERGSLKIVKFLVNVIQWTKICDMKHTIREALRKRGYLEEDETQLKLALFILKNDDKAQILNDDVRLYNVINEGGRLYSSDTSLGSFTQKNVVLDEKTSEQSINSFYASTPRISEVPSSYSEMSDMSLRKPRLNIVRKCKVSTLVIVKLILVKDKISEVDLVLDFPKICNGLYVFERIKRILGSTQCDFTAFTISIAGKAGICIFCLSKHCNGCQMQTNDRILLSHHYVITAYCRDNNAFNLELIDMVEDLSLITNEPISIRTLSECFTQFSESENSLCPTCFENNDWQPSKTSVRKYPEVLITHFERPKDDVEVCVFPHKDFKPLIGERKSKYTYGLVSVVTADDDLEPIVYSFNDAQWSMKFGEETQDVVEPPKIGIQMLVYLKNANIRNTNQSHCKIKRRIRAKKLMRNSTKPLNDITNVIIDQSLREFKYHLEKFIFVPCYRLDIGASEKFSPRSGRIWKPHSLRSTDYISENSSYMTDGTFTTVPSDKDSTCQCSKCKTLGDLHRQMQNKRSATNIVEEKTRNDHLSFGAYSNRSFSENYERDRFLLEKRLHKDIRNQNLKEVVKCLKAGADVNYVFNGFGALHLVAAMASPFGEMFTNLFLEHGGDSNLHGGDGLTPVHIATLWGREETLRILLKHGGNDCTKNILRKRQSIMRGRYANGLAHIKDLEGRSAFELLLKSEGNNTEKLLRILRAENSDDESNRRNVFQQQQSHQQKHVEDAPNSSWNSNNTFLNVSGNSIKETLGEKTFDELFRHNVTAATKTSDNFADESLMTQYFKSDIDSDVSFQGSVKFSLWSMLLCSGKCSKIRRRKGEDRWITRVVRQRILRWIGGIRDRE